MSTVNITAVGLASSLGGIIQAAAAFRAGITRAQDLPWVTAHAHDGERQLVVGHPARPIVEGLDGFAAWLRLALLAWDDCWGSSGVASARLPIQTDGLGFILVMPRMQLGRHGWEVDDPGALLDEHLSAALLSRVGVAIPPTHRSVISCDHTGVAQAMERARERLMAGDWRRAVIMAVDSLLDPSSIRWLAEHGRLKGAGNPNGIAPGEAAVCLVVESPDQSPMGSVTGVEVISAAVHPADFTAPRPSPVEVAKRCHQVFLQCDESSGSESSESGDRTVDHYLDHTGEEWRALVWGNLLAMSVIGRSQHKVWYPAGGFGATGAVSGALGCALALRAFQRGYAKAADALVWSTDDSGGTGVIHLRHARHAG